MSEVTTNQVAELIAQLAAMTAAASITPQTVAAILEKMRNLNDQEREKVIAVAEAYIEEIQNTGIPAEKVLMPNESNAALEFAKRIEFLDLATFDTSQPLPLAKTYIYNSKPVQSVYGTREGGGYYLAFAIGREDNSGYEAYNADVLMFLSESSNPNVFEFESSFNTGEDSLSEDESSVAMAFGAGLASISRAGLMSSEDKNNMNALLTEVFPIKVAIASSNAGTREIGTAVTPLIELNITRKGNDVAASANVEVTPADGSLSQNKKTYTGALISSGSKTYQIAVTQGGQTVNAPAQTFSFLNYRYYGAVSTKPANAAAVKTLCQNGTLTKQLSSSTTMGKTSLDASKYFVFVIPTTSPNLIVKNANSGGTVDNAGSGTFEMARVNGTADLNYKYVIVPASSNAWNFEITN